MQPIETISHLFEEIKKGKYHFRDELFENLWINITRFAYETESEPVLNKIYAWADKHANQHPDFLELTTLTRGFIEFHADHFDIASKLFDKAYDLFSEKKDEDGVAATNICIGFLYRSKGEIDLALKYGLPGMEQLVKSGKFKMIRLIGAYFIGGVYADTGHLDEALHQFQDGLQMDYPQGVRVMAARLTNGIAGVYMKQKNFTLALENFQRALELSDSTTEKTFKARGLTDLGDYYLQMGNYPLAIQYNKEALDIRQEMKIKNGSITNLVNLGTIFNKQGNSKDAIQVLTDALKIAESIRVKLKIFQIHHILSDIYLCMGNTSESLAHYRSFHEIREDVNHEDLDKKVKNQVQLFQAQQTFKENTIIKEQKVIIEKKNIELQETIDELTLTRINKTAKVVTLFIAIILFVFEEQIIHFALHIFTSDNYFLSLFIKIGIIFALKPIDEAIEHYLLRKVIRKKSKAVLV